MLGFSVGRVLYEDCYLWKGNGLLRNSPGPQRSLLPGVNCRYFLNRCLECLELQPLSTKVVCYTERCDKRLSAPEWGDNGSPGRIISTRSSPVFVVITRILLAANLMESIAAKAEMISLALTVASLQDAKV